MPAIRLQLLPKLPQLPYVSIADNDTETILGSATGMMGSLSLGSGAAASDVSLPGPSAAASGLSLPGQSAAVSTAGAESAATSASGVNTKLLTNQHRELVSSCMAQAIPLCAVLQNCSSTRKPLVYRSLIGALIGSLVGALIEPLQEPLKFKGNLRIQDPS